MSVRRSCARNGFAGLSAPALGGSGGRTSGEHPLLRAMRMAEKRGSDLRERVRSLGGPTTSLPEAGCGLHRLKVTPERAGSARLQRRAGIASSPSS